MLLLADSGLLFHENKFAAKLVGMSKNNSLPH